MEALDLGLEQGALTLGSDQAAGRVGNAIMENTAPMHRVHARWLPSGAAQEQI
jgi:hypothetical protein